MPIFEDLLHESRDASGPVTWKMIANLILSTLESRVGKGLFHLYATGKPPQNASDIYDIDRGSDYLP